VPIRWRDLDPLGHLNQAVYHELLEEGRSAMVEKLRSEAEFTFVLARVELDYRNEVRREHGAVNVISRVESVGRSSIVLVDAILLDDGTVVAEGRSVLVAWDAAARRSRPLSGDERDRLLRPSS
jgi:acyl-CoA thioester hydrolase